MKTFDPTDIYEHQVSWALAHPESGGSKSRGIRKIKMCKQKRQQRAHERKIAAKIARRETKAAHGGKRPGAGRPRSDKPRCPCGKMTAHRAKLMRHACKPVCDQSNVGLS